MFIDDNEEDIQNLQIELNKKEKDGDKARNVLSNLENFLIG